MWSSRDRSAQLSVQAQKTSGAGSKGRVNPPVEESENNGPGDDNPDGLHKGHHGSPAKDECSFSPTPTLNPCTTRQISRLETFQVLYCHSVERFPEPFFVHKGLVSPASRIARRRKSILMPHLATAFSLP
jgi:hypothetical protein